MTTPRPGTVGDDSRPVARLASMPGFRSRRTGPRFPPAPLPDDPVDLRAWRSAPRSSRASSRPGSSQGRSLRGGPAIAACSTTGCTGRWTFLERDSEPRRNLVDPPLREGRALRRPGGAARRRGERRALRPRRGLPRRRPPGAEGRRRLAPAIATEGAHPASAWTPPRCSSASRPSAPASGSSARTRC